MTVDSKNPAVYDEPILWGHSKGFSVHEIASGLGIAEGIVMARLEARMPRIVKKLAVTVPSPRTVIDTSRAAHDQRYRNWLRSRQGSIRTQDGNGVAR